MREGLSTFEPFCISLLWRMHGVLGVIVAFHSHLIYLFITRSHYFQSHGPVRR